MRHPLDLFGWQGRVTRAQYLLAGVVLFAIKYPIDWGVSSAFGRPWNPLMYVSLRVSPIFQPDAPAAWLVTLLAVALPFMWIGVSLSARRLRDMGVSPFWAGLFFLPLLQLAFFFALAVAPPAAPAAPERSVEEKIVGLLPPVLLARMVPKSLAGSFVFGLGLALASGLAAFMLSVKMDAHYGAGLFVGVPFGMGFLVSFCVTQGGKANLFTAIALSLSPLVIALLALLAVAWEGIACLIMAVPILFAMAALGAVFGWFVARWTPLKLAGLSAAVLFPPLIASVDVARPAADVALAVDSTVVVHAPPQTVWNDVVSFPPIDAPPDLIFAIVGMPIEARIDGRDPGATRHCIFTNGEFVEPIQTWDEPRELRFGVQSQPDGIGEYVDILGGRFQLHDRGDGTTELVGTTWYRLKVHPAFYWRWWTHTLLHAIHLRVLEHIARLAESDAGAPMATTAAPMPSWMSDANATCHCTTHVGGR